MAIAIQVVLPGQTLEQRYKAVVTVEIGIDLIATAIESFDVRNCLIRIASRS
jgi:hypothetical protein